MKGGRRTNAARTWLTPQDVQSRIGRVAHPADCRDGLITALLCVGHRAAADRRHAWQKEVDVHAGADAADRPVGQDEIDATAAVQASPAALAHVRPAEPADPDALVEVR